MLSMLSPYLVLPAPEPESVISPRSRVPLAVGGVRNQDPGCQCAHSFWASAVDRAREQGVRSVITVIVGASVLMGRVPFTPVS